MFELIHEFIHLNSRLGVSSLSYPDQLLHFPRQVLLFYFVYLHTLLTISFVGAIEVATHAVLNEDPGMVTWYM